MEIKIVNLTYSILKNLNIRIDNNSITTILGDVESGKSELLEVMSGLEKIENGEITFNNKNFKKNELRKKIGFMFSNPEIQFCSETVFKEITLSLKLLNKKIDSEKVNEIIDMIGLTKDYLEVDPQILSSGEKRKVALASILIHDPEIIIINDPVTALDYEVRKKIIQLMKKLKKDFGKTIVIATNDSELAYEISDYIYVLKKGKIVLKGNKYEVFKESDIIKNSNLSLPQLIEFVNYVKENKNINLRYRDNINDLIKDIYRYAE